jgi:hypothetical protein
MEGLGRFVGVLLCGRAFTLAWSKWTLNGYDVSGLQVVPGAVPRGADQ